MMNLLKLFQKTIYSNEEIEWKRMIDICDNFLSTLLDEHRKNYPGKTIDVDKMHDIVLDKLLLQARQIESKVPGFYKRTDSEEEYYFKVSENYYNTLQKKIFQSQVELEKPLFIMVFIQGMFFPNKKSDFATEQLHNVFKILHALNDCFPQTESTKLSIFNRKLTFSLQGIILLCNYFFSQDMQTQQSQLKSFLNSFNKLHQDAMRHAAPYHLATKNHLYNLKQQLETLKKSDAEIPSARIAI